MKSLKEFNYGDVSFILGLIQIGYIIIYILSNSMFGYEIFSGELSFKIITIIRIIVAIISLVTGIMSLRSEKYTKRYQPIVGSLISTFFLLVIIRISLLIIKSTF